jgi:hypothetical protein
MIVSPTRRPPLPPGNIPGAHFRLEVQSIPEPWRGRKEYVNKNSNDAIGNRTRDLPTCSAVTQPTAPTHAPEKQYSA